MLAECNSGERVYSGSAFRLRLSASETITEEHCVMPVYTYTTIDVPLAGHTKAFGINDAGQVVGYYSADLVSDAHGFLFSGGTYTALNDPFATDETFATGINDLGQIVGYYHSNSSGDHGFLYDPTAGIFPIPYLTLNYPSANTDTFANGINDAGQIVGSYNTGGHDHGFLLSAGTYTTLDDPSGSDTEANGINNAGQIVGEYTDASGHSHGFLYDPNRGVFPPTSHSTIPWPQGTPLRTASTTRARSSVITLPVATRTARWNVYR
jgi:probable HAF family extracellular repeat protein